MFPRWVGHGLFNRRRKRHPLAGPETFPTICSDGGRWTTRHYSVRQLVRSESVTFPLIAKVTSGYQEGYYDNGDAMLCTNQVLQIHDSARQTRVDAVDSLGRNLSLPADLPVEVTPTDGPRAGDNAIPTHVPVEVTPTDGSRAGDCLTLAEAAINLPVKVVVLRTKSDDDDATNHALTGQTLLLRTVTNDVFLRACAINKGWIDQSRVLAIPSCIGIEFAVAEGIRGVTDDEWIDYNNMFSRSVRHLNFDLVHGPSEMYILDPNKRESGVNESPYEELLRRRTHEEQEADGDGGGYENPSKHNTWDSHEYTRIQSDYAYDDTDARVYVTIVEA